MTDIVEFGKKYGKDEVLIRIVLGHYRSQILDGELVTDDNKGIVADIDRLLESKIVVLGQDEVGPVQMAITLMSDQFEELRLDARTSEHEADRITLTQSVNEVAMLEPILRREFGVEEHDDVLKALEQDLNSDDEENN